MCWTQGTEWQPSGPADYPHALCVIYVIVGQEKKGICCEVMFRTR